MSQQRTPEPEIKEFELPEIIGLPPMNRDKEMDTQPNSTTSSEFIKNTFPIMYLKPAVPAFEFGLEGFNVDTEKGWDGFVEFLEANGGFVGS